MFEFGRVSGIIIHRQGLTKQNKLYIMDSLKYCVGLIHL